MANEIGIDNTNQSHPIELEFLANCSGSARSGKVLYLNNCMKLGYTETTPKSTGEGGGCSHCFLP